MHAKLSGMGLPMVALVVMACVLTAPACAPGGSSATGGAAAAAASPPFAFGVMGDAPYAAADVPRVEAMIADMNRADLAFVVHIGDVQKQPPAPADGGIPTCTDDSLKHRLELFGACRHPFIITPGDNDWTDCHFVQERVVDPLERLASFRRHFYPGPESLGQRRLTLTVQGADPRFAAFVENRMWTHGGVLFATVHTVGSNNNLERTPAMDAEFAGRDAANRAWLADAFERARREHSRGVVILTQANLQFETVWPASQVRRYLYGLPTTIPEPRSPTGFDGFVEDLRRHVTAFAGPVLLIHGDTHLFRVDKPLFAAPDGRMIENFTRLETFGTPDMHWVRVGVDPSLEGLFAFHPEMTAQPAAAPAPGS